MFPQGTDMETEVRDPDLVAEYEADDKGRINLGTDYAGKRVKVAVGVIENESNEEE